MDKHLRKKISLVNPVHFCALGFGSGLIPFMPGTFGTLVGLPIVFLGAAFPDYVYLLLCIFACLVGVPICGRTAFDMKVHDHGAIVWDEIAGILITFMFIPLSLLSVIVGFLLFRFFDIIKPWPIGFLDKHVSGGKGIMVDDIVAGLMACTCMHALLYLGLL